jgi:tetratricopeptide (TPR) repeat protein
MCARPILLLLALAAAPALADNLEAAKAHFRAGDALYQVGRYSEAAREFTLGYELAPRPQFLLNLGQAYRRMGDLPRAALEFERYLNATPASDPRRAEVQQMIDELHAAPPPPEPSPSPSPEPPAVSFHVGEVMPLLVPRALAAAQSPSPPPRKSFVRRHWWIFPVAAVVVGAAIGLGVHYGTPSTNHFDCSSTIACVDAIR